MFRYLFLIIPFLAASLHSTDKLNMLQDLDVIKATFETTYAPAEWKKQHFGWNLDREIAIAKFKVLSFDSINVKDYQHILRSFFNSTWDFHVRGEFYSTEKSLLPFSVISANGRYFFSEIDYDILSQMQEIGFYQSSLLPSIGDELIIFDSQPIADAIENLKLLELGDITAKSTQWIAELMLTKRLGERGNVTPEGKIEIAFITSEGQVEQALIQWLHLPEKISNRYYTATNGFELPSAKAMSISPKSLRDFEPIEMIDTLASALKKDFSNEYRQVFKELGIKPSHASEDDDSNPPGTSKAMLNRENIAFGEKIWEESPKTEFNVHIYEHPSNKKRIGYVRLRTFHPNIDFESINMLALNLAKTLKFLSTRTHALVIDQVDNTGGYYTYCLAILSMLTKKPLSLPKNIFTLTQSEVKNALDALDLCEDMLLLTPDTLSSYGPSSFILGFPLDGRTLKSRAHFSSFIIDEWNQGKHISSPIAPDGIEQIFPHPHVQYTRPILVLTNRGDFSCGDLFPAVLQDNHRATIFGEQTAGAGGIIKGHSYPNSFGLAKFTYTVSLSERMNGNPIENLGVMPDVTYDLTEKDITQGYTDYIKAVNNTLLQML